MDNRDGNRSDDDVSVSSDGSANDDTRIENGFFGIANEENNVDQLTKPLTDKNDDLKMDTEDETAINQFCNKTDKPPNGTSSNSLGNSSHQEDNDKCVETTDNNFLSNRILGSNSKDLNHPDLQCSFAAISEDYEKSMKNASSIMTDGSKSCHQKSESEKLEINNTGTLPKSNLQSLSMISANYQDSSSETDSSDDDNSADNSQCNDSDDAVSIISISSNPVSKEEKLKTKGELDISDLPPIEDLKISVDEDKCQPVGCIKNIVDTLVIVEAFLNQPALDIDSVLFVDRGQRALGKIFDVFGPVSKPYYAVRFNNSEHIKKFNIFIKEPVFCAPETEYSSFVLISQLLKMKGSDASWRHNNEPPPECLDYSDDEAEKLAKKKKKQQKKQMSNDSDNQEDSPGPPDQNVAGNNPRNDTTQRPFSRNLKRTQQNYNHRPSNHTPNSTYCPPNQNFHTPNSTHYSQDRNSQTLNSTSYSQNQNSYNPNSTPYSQDHSSHTPNSASYSQNQSSHNPNSTPYSQNHSPHTPSYSPRPSNYNPQPNFNLRPPIFVPQPSSYGYGQRQFPSYAQHLSAMEHSQAYRQPYNPWYNDQNMYAPRPNYPYQNPSVPPPGFDHQSYPPPSTDPNTVRYPQQ